MQNGWISDTVMLKMDGKHLIPIKMDLNGNMEKEEVEMLQIPVHFYLQSDYSNLPFTLMMAPIQLMLVMTNK